MTTTEHTDFTAPSNPRWQQGQLVDVAIVDLSDSGDGVGRLGQQVVFVPDTVPGDRVTVRLVRVKPQYAHGKLQDILEPSPQRSRPNCIVADKCGGCQWQHVSYEYQLEAKRNQIIQALERIGGLSQPPVDPMLRGGVTLGYRNKATYPLGRHVKGRGQGDKGSLKLKPQNSKFPRSTAQSDPLNPPPLDPSLQPSNVIAGYYQKGTHHLINLNQCPIQDERLNPLLAEVKQDIEQRGWGIYDETQHRGKMRHLGLRIGRRTGEMLLTLVVKDGNLTGVEEQAQAWLERYPGLVGVALNLNGDRTNAIFGKETRCLAGRPYLREVFAGLTFQIRPDTFFQVNTEQAEALLQAVIDHLNLQGNEVLLDAYCGIGTMTLPLAHRVRRAIGLEIQPEAIQQATENAALNGLENVVFHIGAVENLLRTLEVQPDIVLLDPPRKGCDPAVLEALLQIQPARIVYVSCNPATLARDLKGLCGNGIYHLDRVQPADFFPQTAHVECAAFLTLQPTSESL